MSECVSWLEFRRGWDGYRASTLTICSKSGANVTRPLTKTQKSVGETLLSRLCSNPRVSHQPNSSAREERELEKNRARGAELRFVGRYKTNKARGLLRRPRSSSYTLAVGGTGRRGSLRSPAHSNASLGQVQLQIRNIHLALIFERRFGLEDFLPVAGVASILPVGESLHLALATDAERRVGQRVEPGHRNLCLTDFADSVGALLQTD